MQCRFVAVLAFVLLAWSNAHGAEASAYLRNISFELIDLDLGDGITPSLTVLSSDPVAAPRTVIDTVGAAADLGSFNLDGDLYLHGVAPSDVGSSFTAILQRYPPLFGLSPMTGLVVYADWGVSGSIETACAEPTIDGRPACEFASAAAFLDLHVTTGLTTRGSDAPGGVHRYLYGDEVGSFAESGRFSVYNSNVTSGFALAGIQYGVVADAIYYQRVDVPPIPEPSTYALMLAGLLGVFAMARRRVLPRCLQP